MKIWPFELSELGMPTQAWPSAWGAKRVLSPPGNLD